MRRASFCRDDRGQTLVVVALMLTFLLGFAGLVADVAWYEVNLMRAQRAADAAALAGVVYLPADPTGAVTAARNEAAKNGYTHGVGGVIVNAAPEPLNNKILGVTVSGPVRTIFGRLFGVNSFAGRRNARAEFVLPVPMGSPQDYYGVSTLCDNSGVCSAVASATGSGNLTSQGFWGSILTRGADRGNGDAYSPNWNPRPTVNAGFDAGGYSYIVELPAGTTNGRVWIFDPVFCATGRKTANPNALQRLGIGDFWYGTSVSRTVTTEFRLWTMNGTPYAPSDDTLIASDGGLFTDMDQVDKGPRFRGDGDYGAGYTGGSSADCQSHPYHNAWWPLASGLGEGHYRLQVVTSAGNTGQNSNNQFAIQVSASGAGTARVYGQSRMCAYMNVVGTSTFYLAQVEAAHRGKTLEIKLFDPGDFSNTTLRIKMPTTAGYTNATFSYTADNGRTGSNVTSLVTNDGTNLFQNSWLTIRVNLPIAYDAPAPPGETEPGWWKIEYSTLGIGVDVTTWEVNIRGNPVHLITPT